MSQSPRTTRRRRCGAYELLEVIGFGGMGTVYRAVHRKLGREVALKLLHPEHAHDREAVARFFQEARLVNRIRHPNIVEITDLIEIQDGPTFIIMELLSGESLGDAMESAMDVARGVGLMRQICGALAATHDLGVVHRDLKPDNIFVGKDDRGRDHATLLDFGVAKLLSFDRAACHLTAAGCIIGTPAYMSPEQASGMPIDGRSDVYSLGAIMYELFTGERLFPVETFQQHVHHHLYEQPTRPSRRAGGAHIPGHLEDVILRCLVKEPGQRMPSAGQLGAELGHVADSLEGSSSGGWHPGRGKTQISASPPMPTRPGQRRSATGTAGLETCDDRTMVARLPILPAGKAASACAAAAPEPSFCGDSIDIVFDDAEDAGEPAVAADGDDTQVEALEELPTVARPPRRVASVGT